MPRAGDRPAAERYRKLADALGADYPSSFGSAHATGFNMAFCDASVQPMSYSIDPAVHGYLGSRNDGQAIDGKKF